jgi:hypothetical protein
MFLNSWLTNGDLSDGDAKDANDLGPTVIGRMPKLQGGGTERWTADREVFDETIARRKRQSDGSDTRSLGAASQT